MIYINFVGRLQGKISIRALRTDPWPGRTHWIDTNSPYFSGFRVVIQHCLQKASPTPNLKINRHSFVAISALLDHLWIAICSYRTFATIIPSLVISVTYFQHAILNRHNVIIHVTKVSADIFKGNVLSRTYSRTIKLFLNKNRKLSAGYYTLKSDLCFELYNEPYL